MEAAKGQGHVGCSVRDYWHIAPESNVIKISEPIEDGEVMMNANNHVSQPRGFAGP
jgi:hypothetical protein